MDMFESLYQEHVGTRSKPNVLLDETWRKHFPSLHDFIVKLSYLKHEREHGRITLSAEHGQFKITLVDPTNACSFSLCFASVEECLLGMENHAASGAIQWYFWKGGPLRRRSPSSNGGISKKTTSKPK
jgi:hypothetical protein